MALIDDLQDPGLLAVKVGGTYKACKFVGGFSQAEADAFNAPNVATDPTAPRAGDIWLNTTSKTENKFTRITLNLSLNV